MTQWSVAIVIKGQGRGELRELKRRELRNLSK